MMRNAILLICLVTTSGCDLFTSPPDLIGEIWLLVRIDTIETSEAFRTIEEPTRSKHIVFLEDGSYVLTYSGFRTGGNYQRNENRIFLGKSAGCLEVASISCDRFSDGPLVGKVTNDKLRITSSDTVNHPGLVFIYRPE